MTKFLLAGLIMGSLVFAAPAFAKHENSSFWAAVSKLAQDVFQTEEMPTDFNEEEGEEIMDDDFVDPREVQQTLKEIKDMKKELNRFMKTLRKMQGGEDDQNRIQEMLGQLAEFESGINSGVEVRDAIQEFRDAQLWEELNILRAKIEIPKELKQWNKEVKKIEKMLAQKKYQNLQGLGLVLDGARNKLEEIKSGLVRVQEYYNNGDLESALDELNDLREDFHPGEISSFVQRMQELTNRLRSVKNADVKNQVMESLGEAINSFNEGEYRTARELLDESFGEIMKLINQALSVGKRGGVSKDSFNQMADKLQNQIKNKAEMKKEQFQFQQNTEQPARQQEQMKSSRRQEQQSVGQPEPVKPIERVQPAEGRIQLKPVQPSTENVRPVEPVRPEPVQPPAEAPRPIEPAPAPSVETRPAPEPTR